MSSPFVILHLSDAHLGKPGTKIDVQHVMAPLWEDLKKMRDLVGSPSLIVFTGDLTFGAAPGADTITSQYGQASIFLDKVFAAVECVPSAVPLLLVPGNHDLDRTKLSVIAAAMRKECTAETLFKQMQENTDSWELLLTRQAEWQAFARSRLQHPAFTFDSQLNTMHGRLEHQSVSIGVVGLNTSWASMDDHDVNSLWLGKHQYDLATTYVRPTTFSIIATHHPMNWLNGSERTEMEHRVQSDFRIHFHGHEHASWFVDARKHLRVEGGACYAGSKKPNAYNWLTVDFESRVAAIHLRGYTEEGTRGWVPHVINGVTDKDGCAPVTGLFPPTEGALGPVTTPMHTHGTKSATHALPAKGLSPLKRTTTSTDYISHLVDMFDFTWEPRRTTADAAAMRRRVFWPVRLRLPTPIHAAQCFAAAGLQKRGCEIYLWLDNLGNKECEENDFLPKMRTWIDKGGGNGVDVVVKRCDADLKTKCPADIWAMTEQWLGTTHHRTIDVLRISKIIASNDISGDAMVAAVKDRKPRAMMTPAIVWACLLQTSKEDNQTPIITLGGFDERDLWAAWHQCCGNAGPHAANLYLSELKDANAPVKMARTVLAWTSKQDAIRALRGAFDAGATMSDPHRLPYWALSNCAALPSLLTSDTQDFTFAGQSFNSPKELARLDSTHMEEMAAEVWKWLA